VLPLLQAIPGLSCNKPEGAFYMYVSCAGWIGRHTPRGNELVTDADVGEYLLESGVAVPEGAGYGLSPYFRLSFATSLEKLQEACRRMDAAGRKLA
jgi:aspartate aminotransferase